MNLPSVYNYTNPRSYLLDCVSTLQAGEGNKPLRSIAKDMNLKSHTLLNMWLTGKRPLRVQHSEYLTQGFNLSVEEKIYLQGLIQFDEAKSPEEKSKSYNWLQEIHPENKLISSELIEFDVISNWKYTALLSAFHLKESIYNEDQLCELFKDKLPKNEVRSLVENLLAIELLKEKDGYLYLTHKRITSRDDIANAGSQRYHKSASELAKGTVGEVDVNFREFQSFSMAISQKKMTRAKQLIREFKQKFVDEMSKDDDKDAIYQMNLQLFPIIEQNYSIKGEKK